MLERFGTRGFTTLRVAAGASISSSSSASTSSRALGTRSSNVGAIRSRGETARSGARRIASPVCDRAIHLPIRALMLKKPWTSQPSEIEARSSSSSIGPAAFFAQRSSSLTGLSLCHPKPAAMKIANSEAVPSITAATASWTPDNGPSRNAGTRSMASPTTPPSPLGSGHFGLFGRHEAKPDASRVPPSQSSRRCHSRSKSRCVAMRQPQTATGSTSTVEASPSNCISRSLPIAPVAPSRLRTGASVAWLNDGSCTDHVASAQPIVTASVINAMPPHSRSRRRTAPRRSSDHSETSKVLPVAAMVSSARRRGDAAPRPWSPCRGRVQCGGIRCPGCGRRRRRGPGNARE